MSVSARVPFRDGAEISSSALGAPRAPSPTPGLLDQIVVEHGPAPVLGRFFLAADAGLRRRGVTMSMATFADLFAINAANRDSWKPLMPIYDPTYHDFNDDNSFVMVGRNASGLPVVTVAGLLYDLTGTTYHDYAAALRVNYGDPERMKQPGERCIPTAPSLKTMTGKVGFQGALWLHPSIRKAGVVPYMGRLARSLAYTRWNTDYLTAFIVEGPLKAGLGANTGYQNVEWGITYENTSMGNFSCGFCWMDNAYLMADIEAFTAAEQAAEAVEADEQKRA